MAQHTILNEQEMIELLNHYNIFQISSFKLLSGGSENTNYLAVTKQGNFVVTICEQKTEKEANDLSTLLEHLAQNGFSTSKIIFTKNGKAITLWNNKPIMVKEYLEGKIMKNIPDHLLIFLGTALAALHKINAPSFLPRSINYGQEHFNQVSNYAPESSFNKWLNKISNYLTPFIQTDLPKALIHSDLFYNNIIINDEETTATIMDFEEASYFYRIFDIGMTMVGCCCDNNNLNLKKASALMKGYSQVIQLLDKEWQALQAFAVYGAAATAFWRHRQFNFIHSTPDLFNHYIAMQATADNIKSLPADTFINSLT